MKTHLKSAAVVLAGVLPLLAGCADFVTPTPQEALQKPFGTGAPFTLGTRKAKILESWGNPDHVIQTGSDELGNTREEWIYHGRLPGVPIDYEYVSRTKYLYFEGENLVRWKTEETPKTEQAAVSEK